MYKGVSLVVIAVQSPRISLGASSDAMAVRMGHQLWIDGEGVDICVLERGANGTV